MKKKGLSEARRLRWILDFINKDLDEIKGTEFIKVLIDARENLPSIEVEYPRDSSLEDTPRMHQVLMEVQRRLKNLLEKIYSGKAKKRERLKYKREDISIWVGEGGIFMGRMNSSHALEYEFAELLYACLPRSGSLSNLPYHSLDNIRKCRAPGCDNFFWRAHKREKNYCSNRCTWRAYSQARRTKEK